MAFSVPQRRRRVLGLCRQKVPERHFRRFRPSCEPLRGAVWDHCSHRAPWKPSLGFVGVPTVLSVVAALLLALGGFGRGLRTPPNQNWVSVKRTIFPHFRPNFRVIHRLLACVLNVHVFFVFRARDHFMRRLEKVRNSTGKGEKFNWKGEKFNWKSELKKQFDNR